MSAARCGQALLRAEPQARRGDTAPRRAADALSATRRVGSLLLLGGVASSEQKRCAVSPRRENVSARRRIGVFGGSFDPIHRGHVAILEAAQKHYRFDWIYVVPAYRNPLKQAGTGSLRARLEGVRRAVGSLPFVRVSLVEVKSGKPCYTVDTLRYFARKHPGAKLFWIAGSDILETFGRWKDPAGILKLATVAVAGRPGFKVGRMPRGFELFPMKPVAASSTALRAQGPR